VHARWRCGRGQGDSLGTLYKVRRGHRDGDEIVDHAVWVDLAGVTRICDMGSVEALSPPKARNEFAITVTHSVDATGAVAAEAARSR